jgi:cytochrome c5
MSKHSLLPLAVAAFLASAGPAAAQAFPDGPGKEILEKKCSTCHAPEQVTTFGRSAEEWHEVVVNMIDLGAEVNEEEAKVLVEYLAKNWPVKGSKPAEETPAEKPAEKTAPQSAPAATAPAASARSACGGGRLYLVHGTDGQCPRTARSEDGTDQRISAQNAGLGSSWPHGR